MCAYFTRLTHSKNKDFWLVWRLLAHLHCYLPEFLVQWEIHSATLKNKHISADTFQVVHFADSLSNFSAKSCLLVKGDGAYAAPDSKIFKHGVI